MWNGHKYWWQSLFQLGTTTIYSCIDWLVFVLNGVKNELCSKVDAEGGFFLARSRSSSQFYFSRIDFKHLHWIESTGGKKMISEKKRSFFFSHSRKETIKKTLTYSSFFSMFTSFVPVPSFCSRSCVHINTHDYINNSVFVSCVCCFFFIIYFS